MESCNVLTLCAGACYDITDSRSVPSEAPVKPTKATKKKAAPQQGIKPTARSGRKAAAPAEEHPEQAPACEETATFKVPDPEGEAAKAHPEKHRKGLPAHEIASKCKCGAVSTVYVDDPDLYDDKARQQLFKDRGASYSPAVCGFCMRRRPKKSQAAA